MPSNLSPVQKRRCSCTTRKGEPCRAWAMQGTDPPVCIAHAEQAGAEPGLFFAALHPAGGDQGSIQGDAGAGYLVADVEFMTKGCQIGKLLGLQGVGVDGNGPFDTLPFASFDDVSSGVGLESAAVSGSE